MNLKTALMKKTSLLCLVIMGNTFNNDHTFYRTAGEFLQLEISLGRIAEQNGSARTKLIGRTIADDLTVANNELKPIASIHNPRFPAELSDKSHKEVQDLNDLQGKTFDETYTISQKRNLKHLIGIFKQESENGKDVAAQTYAGRYLPKLYMHLQLFTADSSAIKITVDSTPTR